MNLDIFQEKRVHAIQKHIISSKKYNTILPQLKIQSIFNKNNHQQRKQLRQNRFNHQIHTNESDIAPIANFILKRKISALNMRQNILLANKAKMILNNNHNLRIKKDLIKIQNQQLSKNYTEFSYQYQYSNVASFAELQIIEKQSSFTSIQKDKRPVKKAQELTFMVKKADNNEDLVIKILSERKIWKQISSGVANLKWIFYKDHHNYKKMNYNMKKRVINHFQFNEEITTKDSLIRNLQIYCQTKKIELFSLTPITFIIDFDSQYCQYHIKKFLQFFIKNDPRLESHLNLKENIFFDFINKLQPYMYWEKSQIKKKVSLLSKPIYNKVYYRQNSYLWLLKPTGLNRGRGIQLFDSIQQLQNILLKYFEQMNRKKKKQTIAKNYSKILSNSRQQLHEFHQNKSDKQEKQQINDQQSMQREKKQEKNNFEKFTLNNCSFVIQKYIEEPFLINNRKFDIRVWALVTDQLNIYFFKEGYIRTSTEAFSTQNINNYFIHLTNNAIQKYSQHYGQFQNANQLSFWALQEFMSQQQVQEIWKKIKEISFMAFSSVKKKLNPNGRKYCFQIFGLDYIIDSEKKVWLIEVNENPCIECSSPLLGQIIPRMLNDAFRLTIDKYFYYKGQIKAYPVNNYDNDQNLWQKLGQLLPNSQYLA